MASFLEPPSGVTISCRPSSAAERWRMSPRERTQGGHGYALKVFSDTLKALSGGDVCIRERERRCVGARDWRREPPLRKGMLARGVTPVFCHSMALRGPLTRCLVERSPIGFLSPLSAPFPLTYCLVERPAVVRRGLDEHPYALSSVHGVREGL